jgi:hypothetical protein
MLRFALACALIIATGPVFAADLGTPRLSDKSAIQSWFDPSRFLTTGGAKYAAGRILSIEPQLGLGYEMRERDISSGYDEVAHRVHAWAGSKLALSRAVSLSVAAKLPLYTYTLIGRRFGDDLSYQSPVSRQDYDLFHHPGGNLGWSSEVGFHLSRWSELDLFFDQTPFAGAEGENRAGQTDQRIGTRLIFHFW